MRRLIAIIATVLALAALMPTALAKGKPSPGTAVRSTIVLNETDPHLGGVATFTTTIATGIKSPMVAVTCYQGGQVVYSWTDVPPAAFLLGGGYSAWVAQGGPADCSAELYYLNQRTSPITWVTLATTIFTAAGSA